MSDINKINDEAISAVAGGTVLVAPGDYNQGGKVDSITVVIPMPFTPSVIYEFIKL